MSSQPVALNGRWADVVDASTRQAAVERAKRISDVRADPIWFRRTAIALAVAFLALFIVVPLLNVFAQALSKGIAAYGAAITHPDALAAIWLTLATALIAVVLITVLGLLGENLTARFQEIADAVGG